MGTPGASKRTLSLDQFYKEAKKVPSFSGGDPDDLRYYTEDLTILRTKFKALIDFGELTDQDIIFNTITGKARGRFLTYHRQWRNWEDFLDQLQAQYGHPRDVLRARLTSLRFKLGDNAKNFCDEYLDLNEQLGYETTGIRAVEEFVAKLEDLTLRMHFKERNPASLMDACRLLKQLASVSLSESSSPSASAAVVVTPAVVSSASATPAVQPASKVEVPSAVDSLTQKFDELTISLQEGQRQIINLLRDRHGGQPHWQRNRDGFSHPPAPPNSNSRSGGPVQVIRAYEPDTVVHDFTTCKEREQTLGHYLWQA
jgi:hypothetical protein